MEKVFLELISICMRDKKVTGNSQYVFMTGKSCSQFLSTMRQAALWRKVGCFFTRLQLSTKLGWQELHEGLYDKSCNWQKKKTNPDAIEQTDSWLINEQLWRNDLAGLWKSGILEQCDLVSKKSTAAWAVLKEWSWSQAHTWSAACPSQFWVPKDKKEINCWHKSKKIREHSTSRGWENWFCSPEHNLI